MCKNSELPQVVAYDRIQRSAARSPMKIGDIVLVQELCKDGVVIRGIKPDLNTGSTLQHTKRVPWCDIALAKVDPLMPAFQEVLETMQNFRKGAA